MAEAPKKTKHLELLESIIASGGKPMINAHFTFPPGIGKTLGLRFMAVGPSTATFEMDTDPALHGNPMGTIHGGVFGEIADAAIGFAHSTTLEDGESFTSIDLQINFFRPVWKDTLRATARIVHQGKTVSRYVCDVTRGDGKVAAQVVSTVMTLRGDQAKGR